MRTGAAAGHPGYFHEALPYASDDELLAVLVPFLTGGLAAGEPTVVALGERNAAVVRAALPEPDRVTFLGGGDTYRRPAGAVRAYRRLFADHVAAGAAQIRVVGELPADVFGATWDWWARYESAINHAYDEFPLWSMCAYHTTTTPGAVLADVMRTHPRSALPDGRHVPHDRYVEPVQFLTEQRPVAPDPVQARTPWVVLAAPSAAEARRAVRAAGAGLLPDAAVADLLVAVSETVTNADLYGRDPVEVRVWRGDDRIVVTVRDGGDGPKDPFAGLLPLGDGGSGGRGLWISHQSCDHVTSSRGPDGWTVRMTVGATG